MIPNKFGKVGNLLDSLGCLERVVSCCRVCATTIAVRVGAAVVRCRILVDHSGLWSCSTGGRE